jgi:hypothetical protein
VSADLELAADPAALERAADPAAFIVDACERAKAWLKVVLEQGDIESIVECKSQAEAIRVYTMSKQLGKDAQLSAAEIVRRAERGIGVAIRRGQEEGTIVKHGHRAKKGLVNNESNPRPVTDFAPHSDLSGNSQQPGYYDLADGVSDEDFDAAVGAARSEGNLSRANVARKIRRPREDGGEWTPAPTDRTTAAVLRRRELIAEMAVANYSSRQIGERLGIADDTIRKIAKECRVEIPADAIVGRTRALDSSRIVRETVHALEGLAMGVQLADVADLDPSEADSWAASLTESIRVLNRLVRSLRERAQP